MAKTLTSPLLHITGPKGSGKTTITRLLLESLEGLSVLVVDASEDTFLGLSYSVTEQVCLSSLLAQIAHAPGEQSEWALHDLPIGIPAGTDTEMLCLGQLPDTLTEKQAEFLHYTLPRLFATYEVVVWDGPMGVLQPVLSGVVIDPVIILTRGTTLSDVNDFLNAPAKVLLNKASSTESLPDFALEQTHQGNWRFLGKLPYINTPETRVKELPDYFQECFYKFDLPFTTPSIDA